jgi:hypothetical protein
VVSGSVPSAAGGCCGDLAALPCAVGWTVDGCPLVLRLAQNEFSICKSCDMTPCKTQHAGRRSPAGPISRITGTGLIAHKWA